MGRATLRCQGRPEGDFLQLGHHETLAELRTALSARVVHYDVDDLDASAIRLSVPRAFTQEISRFVYGRTVAGRRQWDGIVYLSKYGDDLENWAFFEPSAPAEQSAAPFDRDDPDLIAALGVHILTMG